MSALALGALKVIMLLVIAGAVYAVVRRIGSDSVELAERKAKKIQDKLNRLKALQVPNAKEIERAEKKLSEINRRKDI